MKQYEIVAAAPYCCVCAVVESMLKRHGYPQTQYDLANYAGIVVPENDVESLPKELTNVTTSNSVSNYGIHLHDDTLNSFFGDNGIPLKETYISSSCISDMNFESILDSTSEEYDILFFFDYGVLHHEARNRDVGHCVLYITKDQRNLTYQDPGPRGLGINIADIDDMIDAIRVTKSGGISIISPIV